MLLFSIVACESTEEVDISKYPIITTAKEISEAYDLKLDLSGNSEKSTLTDYGDGSYKLSYDYDLLDTDEYQPFFLSIEIDYGINLLEAIRLFEASKTGVLDTQGPNQEYREVTDLDIPGSDAHYSILYGDDKPKGAFLLVRQLHRIYYLMIAGVDMEDHLLIKEQIIPKLENLHLEKFEG